MDPAILLAHQAKQIGNGVLICISSMSGYSHESVPALAQFRPQLDELYKEWDTPGYYEKVLNFVESHLGASGAYYTSKYFVRQFVRCVFLKKVGGSYRFLLVHI